MIKDISGRIPAGQPDLKIGSLSVWITGLVDADEKMLPYLSTPTLFDGENVTVISERSVTPLSYIEAFLKGVVGMHERAGRVAELPGFDSEFGINLTLNDLGHIELTINYYSWAHEGGLEMREMIDQSYLPEIIMSLRKIIDRFSR